MPSLFRLESVFCQTLLLYCITHQQKRIFEKLTSQVNYFIHKCDFWIWRLFRCKSDQLYSDAKYFFGYCFKVLVIRSSSDLRLKNLQIQKLHCVYQRYFIENELFHLAQVLKNDWFLSILWFNSSQDVHPIAWTAVWTKNLNHQ